MEYLTTWLSEHAVGWGFKIIIAIAIFVIGKYLARMITKLLQKALSDTGTDAMLVKFLGNIAYVILLVAVVFAAIDSVGINVTSLLAVLGAAGLAVGLAMKDSLSNIASGVMIIILRPFKIGDYITAGGISGTVDEIGLFCTLLHSGDNKRIIVPNSAIFGGTIVNTSALSTRRIDLIIGIGYGDNIAQARDIIIGIMAADERILKDPEASVSIAELAESSIDLKVRPWVNADDYWSVRPDLLEQIKLQLDAAGITIPYPQQDVHMHEVKAAA